MFQRQYNKQIKLFIQAFVTLGLTFISTISFSEERHIPEFTKGIVDDTDLDLTGHILVVTDRGRYYPTPDFYCGSFEMLVYEATVIHPSGGIITSLEVGIPAIKLSDALIPKVEVWPGTRFEVVYVLNCEALGFPSDPRQLVLELRKF